MAFRPLVRRLSRSSLLWQTTLCPKNLNHLSWSAGSASSGSKRLFKRRSLLVAAGLGSCAVVVWGLERARRDSRPHLLPVANAGGKADGGKAREEAKPKISARELRYKAFASYVYKGEPYMSARDFLESLIRDEPRCK